MQTEETTTKLTARYIDSADAAKLMRKNLAREFPGVKFSVKISRYAGGSSIRVGWTDGPTEAMVQKITAPFSGKGFDGMIDMEYFKNSWLCPDGRVTFACSESTEGSAGSIPAKFGLPPSPDAELVYFGSGYIFTNRKFTMAFILAVVARFKRTYGEADIEIREWDGGANAHADYNTGDEHRLNTMKARCFWMGGNLAEAKA